MNKNIYYPEAGDRVTITRGAGYKGATGIVTGIENETFNTIWYYIQLEDVQTVLAKKDSLELIKRPANREESIFYKLAKKSDNLRREIRKEEDTQAKKCLKDRLNTANTLLSILTRNTGG